MTRVPHFVLIHLVLYALLPATAPSNAVRPELLTDAPNAEEITLLEGISRWLDPAVTSNLSLRQEIRGSMSFELFRGFHDQADRHALLAQLPYGDEIRRTAEDRGLDGLLLAAVVEAESSFDPLAISRCGAMGLMQVMPATASLADDNLLLLADPHFNLAFGAQYLSELLERYEGDLELALAAYNAGPANVTRYGGMPPFRETRAYVERVLRLYIEHHREVWSASGLAELLRLEPPTGLKA